MTLNFAFFFNSILLGIGLAMDAFSVSLANGLNERMICKRKICLIAGTFSLFQALMPLIGWLCVHTVLKLFTTFEYFIPWIVLVLLSFIGGKMIYESLCEKHEHRAANSNTLTLSVLTVQGIATSIDALSAGFTISEYPFYYALLSASIIAAITFVICCAGVMIGYKAGVHLSEGSGIFGGIILIIIGLEIFISHVL